MRKAYLDTSDGQVHARFWHEDKPGLPLLCLPPAPHTGLYFETLAARLDYPMIAVDYPGTGGSMALQHKPNISLYAKSIGALLPILGKVNLLGFHTGCLIALELSENFQANIERTICIDFPLFDAPTRKKYLKGFGDLKPPKNPDELSKSFEGTVVKRRGEIGEARALALWVESLRAGPRYNDPFQAAFGYDAEAALRSTNASIHFIATQSSLLEPTRRAADLASNGRLTEVIEIEGNVFENGAAIIANTIRDDIL